ncbi:MAG: hypothetical protein ABSG86_25220 [Thermoguttaceae bacterium]|jgi:uncharacterized membrane protein
MQRMTIAAAIFLSMVLAPCCRSAAAAAGKTVKVLLVSGDWKSQAWYQDVVMGKKDLYRGRFIADRVRAAAPGRFEFTDVTNYIGQEYIDADYLSQFDVLVMGDVYGWGLSSRFHEAIGDFVKRGGGFIYCASYKWHTAMLNGTGFQQALPITFPSGNLTIQDDWMANSGKSDLPEADFVPVAAKAGHPAVAGIDWSRAPRLAAAFRILPKPAAVTLLKTPRGEPILVAWQLGKGRAVCSSAIWANDELADKFRADWDRWPDFGKYYAQLLAWAAENSTAAKAGLRDAVAEVSVKADYSQTLGKINTGIFSIHAAHDCPGLAPLEGEALANFQALHPQGGFSRFSVGGDDFEPERGKYNYQDMDRQMAEIRRLGLEPLALVAWPTYVPGKWMKLNWQNPTDQALRDFADQVAAIVEHANGGKGASPAYRPNLKYLEICNEPGVNGKNVDAYVKLIRTVAERIHRDYPGVRIGCLGGYEVPYAEMFIDHGGLKYADWISRHPYGWTGETCLAREDQVYEYARRKGFDKLEFIITECDFWICGRVKHDYMVKRFFEAVRREHCTGLLHYRLGQYAEPIYMFGMLWCGWDKQHAQGAPMHDAYDAYWLFRDFRGRRAAVEKTLLTKDAGPGLAGHVWADAARNGDKLCLVLYYDWAYDGSGYKDYTRGLNFSRMNVRVQLAFPAVGRARKLAISRADGEGTAVVKQNVAIAPGQTGYSDTIELAPLVGVSIAVE